MNPAFLHRQHGRSIFWIAFMSAIAIHLGAVALAKNKSPVAKLEHFTPPGAVDIVDASEQEPAPEESVTPPPLEEIHPDQDSFQERNLTPPPIRAHRKVRPTSLIRGTTATPSLRSVKAMVAYAPRPVYPYEARRQRVTGSGVALLTVDQTSGAVTNIIMAESCGKAILDHSTLDALRRFQARGCYQGPSTDHVHAYGRFLLALTVGGCVILCARRKDIRSDAKRHNSQTGGIRGNCRSIPSSASSICSTHNW